MVGHGTTTAADSAASSRILGGNLAMSTASKSAMSGWLFGGVLLLCCSFLALPAIVSAFQEDVDASKRDSAELEVVIKREALKLTDPRTYKTSMHLEAVKTVDLTAPV